MSYTRYFSIRAGNNWSQERNIPGASVLSCTFLGREKGGLCSTAEAEIPAKFPNDYGIQIGDYLLIGYSSAYQWWHGFVDEIDKGGVGSSKIVVHAIGLEEQLKAIKPRVNFGYEPPNPYMNYDHKAITAVSASVDSVVYHLWNSFIKGKIKGCGSSAITSFDDSAAATDVTYLDYDGSSSLYEILCALAQRTGMSWGFLPTTVDLDNHTLFFKNPDTSCDINFSRFKYGETCFSLTPRKQRTQALNDIIIQGAKVPKIGKTFTRSFKDTVSAAQYGPIHKVLSIPGIKRTTDAQVEAAAILDRKRDPDDTFESQCIVYNQSGAGPLIYAGRTQIEITNANGGVYNTETDQKYAYQIEATFKSSVIELSFTLGEVEDSSGEMLGSAIDSRGKSSPKLQYEYFPTEDEEWTLNADYTDPTDRTTTIEQTGVIITEPEGDPPTADVMVSGQEESDPSMEVYQNIPVPPTFKVGDITNLKSFFEDDELKSVTAEAPKSTETGGQALDETEVIKVVRFRLADGTIPIFNTTRIKDISGYEPEDKEDLKIVAGESTYPEARVGHLVRVPEANAVALNTAIYAIVSASYNTAGLALPAGADKPKAQLWGQVLGVTTGGEIALGNPSGGLVIVNCKTGDAQRRTFYMIEALDTQTGLTVCAPRGAVTRGNVTP